MIRRFLCGPRLNQPRSPLDFGAVWYPARCRWFGVGWLACRGESPADPYKEPSRKQTAQRPNRPEPHGEVAMYQNEPLKRGEPNRKYPLRAGTIKIVEFPKKSVPRFGTSPLGIRLGSRSGRWPPPAVPNAGVGSCLRGHRGNFAREWCGREMIQPGNRFRAAHTHDRMVCPIWALKPQNQSGLASRTVAGQSVVRWCPACAKRL